MAGMLRVIPKQRDSRHVGRHCERRSCVHLINYKYYQCVRVREVVENGVSP